MSWLLSKIYDAALGPPERGCLRRWRAELLQAAQGEVLEVGAGTGLNLPHYPPTAQRVVLSEPDPAMRAELQRKLGRVRTWDGRDVARFQLSEASLERLPFPEASFDTAVCTLVLCSVPDPRQAAQELFRVLRPGGRLLFVEHVAAEASARRQRWQQRIEPLWKRVAGNCHLTRQSEALLREVGFHLHHIQREELCKAPAFIRPSIRGEARKVDA